MEQCSDVARQQHHRTVIEKSLACSSRSRESEASAAAAVKLGPPLCLIPSDVDNSSRGGYSLPSTQPHCWNSSDALASDADGEAPPPPVAPLPQCLGGPGTNWSSSVKGSADRVESPSKSRPDVSKLCGPTGLPNATPLCGGSPFTSGVERDAIRHCNTQKQTEQVLDDRCCEKKGGRRVSSFPADVACAADAPQRGGSSSSSSSSERAERLTVAKRCSMHTDGERHLSVNSTEAREGKVEAAAAAAAAAAPAEQDAAATGNTVLRSRPSGDSSPTAPGVFSVVVTGRPPSVPPSTETTAAPRRVFKKQPIPLRGRRHPVKADSSAPLSDETPLCWPAENSPSPAHVDSRPMPLSVPLSSHVRRSSPDGATPASGRGVSSGRAFGSAFSEHFANAFAAGSFGNDSNYVSTPHSSTPPASPTPTATAMLGNSFGNRNGSAFLQQGLLSMLSTRDEEEGAMDAPITAHKFYSMREQQQQQRSCGSLFKASAKSKGSDSDGENEDEGMGEGDPTESTGGACHSTGALSMTSQCPFVGSVDSGNSADLSARAAILSEAPLNPNYPDVNGNERESKRVHRRCLKLEVVEHTTVMEEDPYTRCTSLENMNTFYCLLNRKYVVYQRELGNGSFSRVQLAYNTEDGAFYAVKILNKHKLLWNGLSSEGAALQVQHEINVMRQLRHKNIIALKEVFDCPSSRKAYLVLELAERGEVITMRGDGSIEPFDDGLPCLDEFTAVRVVKALLQAVMYAHHLGIAHRDIKPSNILLTAEGVVKLSDFGVSTFVDDSTVKVRREGSMAFLPPEMLLSSEMEVARWTPTHTSSMTTVTIDEPAAQCTSTSTCTSTRTTEGCLGTPTAQYPSASRPVDYPRPHDVHSVRSPPDHGAPAAGENHPSWTSREEAYADWLRGCYHPVDLFKADVFAIGVTTFALIMGRLPWPATDAPSRLKAILKSPDPFLADYRQAYGASYNTPAAHSDSGWISWCRGHNHRSGSDQSSNAGGGGGYDASGTPPNQQQEQQAPPLPLVVGRSASECTAAFNAVVTAVHVGADSSCAPSETTVSGSKQGATSTNEDSFLAFGSRTSPQQSVHPHNSGSNLAHLLTSLFPEDDYHQQQQQQQQLPPYQSLLPRPIHDAVAVSGDTLLESLGKATDEPRSDVASVPTSSPPRSVNAEATSLDSWCAEDSRQPLGSPSAAAKALEDDTNASFSVGRVSDGDSKEEREEVRADQGSSSTSASSVEILTNEILRDKLIRPYPAAEALGLPGVPGERCYISAEAVDFIRSCLEIDSAHRRSVFELYHHPWIQSLVRTTAQTHARSRSDNGAFDDSSTIQGSAVSADSDSDEVLGGEPVYDIEDELDMDGLANTIAGRCYDTLDSNSGGDGTDVDEERSYGEPDLPSRAAKTGAAKREAVHLPLPSAASLATADGRGHCSSLSSVVDCPGGSHTASPILLISPPSAPSLVGAATESNSFTVLPDALHAAHVRQAKPSPEERGAPAGGDPLPASFPSGYGGKAWEKACEAAERLPVRAVEEANARGDDTHHLARRPPCGQREDATNTGRDTSFSPMSLRLGTDELSTPMRRFLECVHSSPHAGVLDETPSL